jgi:hypothetical protein
MSRFVFYHFLNLEIALRKTPFRFTLFPRDSALNLAPQLSLKYFKPTCGISILYRIFAVQN